MFEDDDFDLDLDGDVGPCLDHRQPPHKANPTVPAQLRQTVTIHKWSQWPSLVLQILRTSDNWMWTSIIFDPNFVWRSCETLYDKKTLFHVNRHLAPTSSSPPHHNLTFLIRGYLS
jgi:hypothetical protein